jgi:4-diphosphocytidyl-2-C-methyl-D-erythritol kinase
MSSSVRELARAKLNLFLEIRGRRADGFHEIDTLMHEIDLADEVELFRASKSSLEIDVPELELGEDNLGLRALRATEAHVGRDLPTRICIRKRIPAGGGLGGGSSDATAVIRGVNRLYELGLGVAAMEEIAARVGSDTAFFVRGGTAVCRGRGELVTPVVAPRPLHFMLLLPGIEIPTGPVFAELSLPSFPREGYALLRRLAWGIPLQPTDAALFNRLEAPARRLHSDLDEILCELAPQGFRLSGSGSTCFAITDSAAAAHEGAARWSELLGRRVIAACSARRRS